jgi:hypothetical protein
MAVLKTWQRMHNSFNRYLKGRTYERDPGIDGRLISKWIIGKQDVRG